MRWGPVALTVVALVAAGCGNADKVETGSAPTDGGGSTTAETPTGVVESTPGSPPLEPSETEAGGELDVDTDTQPTAGPVDPNAQAALAGLSLIDPLPPQPDGVTDPGGAEAAVRFAYEHWILIDLDAELRGRLMENGDAHADEMAAGMAKQRVGLEGATIGVQSVAIVDAEHADVTYQVYWLGHPSPTFPEPRSGGAVFADGTWRITASTVCVLALGAGFGCPLQDSGDNPVRPAALRLVAVPKGLSRAGDPEARDVLNVDGNFADWIGDSDSWMTLWFSSRPGVSQLSADDSDALLLQYAGGSGSVPVQIGGRPARYFRNEVPTQDCGTVEMFLVVLIRADDVIVQANVSDVPIDEVLPALASLTPTEAVPRHRPDVAEVDRFSD